MAPKASAGGGATPKKGSKKAGEEPSEKKPKLKIPRSFIARPTVHLNSKSITKCYMNGQVLKGLELEVGSLVHVRKEGESSGVLGTVAAGDAGCEFNVVQVSSSLRCVGGFLLGDRLEVSRVAEQPQYGSEVVVGTLGGVEMGERAVKSVEKLLEEVGIVMPGMVFRKFACPGRDADDDKVAVDLVVVSVGVDELPELQKLSLGGENEPDEPQSYQSFVTPPVLFRRGATRVVLSRERAADARYGLRRAADYSQIGGLGQQIELLKSAIELPLHQPELFTEFGITPPRGILLHGPPGTGKTMLLRAVAQETNAHVLTINGPSIVSKYLGESESALRDLFSEARRYEPAIIFMDEIDSLAPSRASDDSGEAESRIVATLLTLMDGVGDQGRLVVVGATNRPNAVDPALRRPGRFDQEVEIGIPNVEQRLDILRLQFSKMRAKHALSDEDIAGIAGRTHGYVGADLVALCRESAMKTIQKGLKLGTRAQDLRVGLADVELALQEVRPSAMREIFLEMPKVYWRDIGGQHELKQKLKEMIQLPLEAAATFQRLGVNSPKGVLLYGPPGCSKTLTAKALATESGVNFLAVKGPEIFNKYVGESERAVREVFRKARAAAPSIIFFDEIDALSPDRSEGGSTSAANHVLTSLLNEIDGVEELKGVVIVAATNRPDEIDPALLRPGRLDRHIYVAPPDYEARLQILANSTSKMNLGSEVDLSEFALRTEGCSGAEVVLLCQEAGLSAIMENPETDTVQLKHFEKALAELGRGITPEMLEYYQRFAQDKPLAL